MVEIGLRYGHRMEEVGLKVGIVNRNLYSKKKKKKPENGGKTT